MHDVLFRLVKLLLIVRMDLESGGVTAAALANIDQAIADAGRYLGADQIAQLKAVVGAAWRAGDEGGEYEVESVAVPAGIVASA